MKRQLRFLLFLIIPLTFSCESKLDTDFQINECQPILYNMQYTWDILDESITCGTSTFSHSFFVTADYTGCLDSTVTIKATLSFMDAAGKISSQSVINDQWYEDVGKKLFFGYCVNWGTTSQYIKVEAFVETASGKTTNPVFVIVHRPPGI